MKTKPFDLEAAIAPLCKRTGAKAGSQLITTEQAEAYAKAVRDEAVKRARPTYYSDGYQDGWNTALDKAADLVGGSSMTSRHAAASIRALKREQS